MSQQFRNLSSRGRAYVAIVSAIGLTIALQSLAQVFVQQVNFQWLILAALTLLTGSFTVRIPKINARLSVSDTFVFASVLLFGPAAGTITVLLDALIISLRLGHHAREPFRVIFNVSLAALSTWLAAQVFFAVSGIQPYSIEHTPLGRILFPLFLFTLAYFVVNSWLVTFALALEQGRPPYPIWRDNFFWLGVNYFGGASVAGLLVTQTREIDITTLGMIVPLLLISYLTFKTSLGRIEDANQHLTQVNKMYLSTIETLAMAIDAKDQITHGHIRRVQRLAVGLAKAVGVNDDLQIKAIEAAALLHDMGKLAIPEFILNKPGKLTPNEFDVMKQHANIGAEILGSIHFPYPVVPIVRHHHEAWDGSGYPDKLKGVAIPLGARILSVVDCFDALTSDRPYRPALSKDDAIAVLLQRRGTMYDPLIVDRFIEAQGKLSEIAATSASESEAIENLATKLRVTTEPATSHLGDVDARLPLKALSLLRSVRPSPAGTSIGDLGLLISSQLSKLTNYSTLAIYCFANNQRSLECRFADGHLAILVDGSEVHLGEKLSGWVAAHRTPIWNSDATLDLPPDVARSAGVALGSSVPLIDGEILVGTLTFYSAAGAEIGLEQRVLIQSIAPVLASALSSSIAHDELMAVDGTRAQDREAIYSILDALLSGRTRGLDKNAPERTTVVRVRFHVDPSVPAQFDSMQTTLERAIAAAANNTGHVIRLAANDVIIAAAHKHLVAAGLAPTISTKAPKRTDIEVAEIVNSLQLREILGLTIANENAAQSDRPLIH
ncbi:MAG: HD domain-containing protein [Cyanobacteria bacterium]|nr:HD domain-containing protein [Cyanobacteriota bacterium]